MIEDPKPTTEEDELRQAERRGMSKVLMVSTIIAGLALFILFLIFAM